MGGVDRTDQLLKPYEVPRKTLKWYKKLAIHFMQLSILNSFIVYQKDGGQKSFLGFQREVIEALIFETGADMEIPREEHVIRLTERHFVSPVPETASKQKPEKRCRVCYKKKVRKDSRYTTVQTVQAIRDFVTIHVLNFTTLKSITGCETPHWSESSTEI